jgi:ubiquitin-protein ligase
MFGPTGLTLTPERHRRFEADRRVLADLHPDMRHYIWAGSGNAFAEGMMHIDVGAGCFEPVEIRLDFGPRYPQVPPTVYETGGRWRPNMDRHIVCDGSFCLWLPNVDPPDVSAASGFREFLLRLLLFLRDQFVYDDLGRWPGRDWPHGPIDAYACHVSERLGVRDTATFKLLWQLVIGGQHRPDRRCPCGSKLHYDRCHRRDIDALRWIGRHKSRAQIAAAIEEKLNAA